MCHPLEINKVYYYIANPLRGFEIPTGPAQAVTTGNGRKKKNREPVESSYIHSALKWAISYALAHGLQARTAPRRKPSTQTSSNNSLPIAGGESMMYNPNGVVIVFAISVVSLSMHIKGNNTTRKPLELYMMGIL